MLEEGYLPWIKNLSVSTHGGANYYNLTGSAVQCLYEPGQYLSEMMQRYGDEIAAGLCDVNSWGHPRLIEIVSRKYGIPDTTRIAVTGSGTVACFQVCHTLLKPGDEVIVESPVYDPFWRVPVSLRAQVSFVEREKLNFRLDPARLEAILKSLSRPKLIILTNLHNPTGAFLPDETLREVGQIAEKYNVKVLVDEVFHDLVVDKQPSVATFSEVFISINSLSKVYGMGNATKAGWIIAAPEVAEQIRQTQVRVEGTSSSLDQTLASVILNHVAPFKAHWTQVTQQNRELLRKHITPLLEEGLLEGPIPAEGCVYFPRLTRLDGDSFARQAMEKYRLLLVSGSFFRAPQHLRLGYGGKTSDLEKNLTVLAEAVRRLID